MQYTVVSLLAFAAAVNAQCYSNFDGQFTFTPGDVAKTEALKNSPPGKRDIEEVCRKSISRSHNADDWGSEP